jgi:hypothetical protein
VSRLTYDPGKATLYLGDAPIANVSGLRFQSIDEEAEAAFAQTQPSPTPTVEEALSRAKDMVFEATFTPEAGAFDRLSRALARAWDGHPRTVLVDGEPMIPCGFEADTDGRTRLTFRAPTLLELAREPNLTQRSVLLALEDDGYHPWKLARLEQNPALAPLLARDPYLAARWQDAKAIAGYAQELRAEDRVRRQREAAERWGARRCQDKERKDKRRAQRLARRKQR